MKRRAETAEYFQQQLEVFYMKAAKKLESVEVEATEEILPAFCDLSAGQETGYLR